MRKNWVVFSLIIVLFSASLLALNYSESFEYRKFEVVEVNGSSMEQVYASCTCHGLSLMEMHSYPPQFSCTGIEICKPVNYTRESPLP